LIYSEKVEEKQRGRLEKMAHTVAEGKLNSRR